MTDNRRRWQRVALEQHCRLACETMNPALRRSIQPGITIVLSVNSGYE